MAWSDDLWRFACGDVLTPAQFSTKFFWSCSWTHGLDLTQTTHDLSSSCIQLIPQPIDPPLHQSTGPTSKPSSRMTHDIEFHAMFQFQLWYQYLVYTYSDKPYDTKQKVMTTTKCPLVMDAWLTTFDFHRKEKGKEWLLIRSRNLYEDWKKTRRCRGNL